MYEDWLGSVDAELVHYGNVDACDVGDWLLRECFEQGMTPEQAARSIIERW